MATEGEELRRKRPTGSLVWSDVPLKELQQLPAHHVPREVLFRPYPQCTEIERWRGPRPATLLTSSPSMPLPGHRMMVRRSIRKPFEGSG